MRKVIITGDDFGLARGVNEAIEEAHRRGVLTAASLMVGAEAAADAVDRARRFPSLKVGLHLVLVDGSPVLPPHTVPHLTNQQGKFSSNLVYAGMNFFFRPGIRQQLEAEIRAQFEAFRKTGLPLDHVNTHHHMHLHPTVLSLILEVGRDYGMRAVRLPYEPLVPSWHASKKAFFGKAAAYLCLLPWLALLHVRLKRANVRTNEFIFGMNDSGNMHLQLVLRFLKYLPQGVTEIYFHPYVASCPKTDHAPENAPPSVDFETLTSPAILNALLAAGVDRIAFCDLD